MPELIKAVEELEWRLGYSFLQNIIYLLFCSLPTAIQAEAIPLVLGGGDVLAVREKSLYFSFLSTQTFPCRLQKQEAERLEYEIDFCADFYFPNAKVGLCYSRTSDCS
jgi:hypothetical protein